MLKCSVGGAFCPVGATVLFAWELFRWAGIQVFTPGCWTSGGFSSRITILGYDFGYVLVVTVLGANGVSAIGGRWLSSPSLPASAVGGSAGSSAAARDGFLSCQCFAGGVVRRAALENRCVDFGCLRGGSLGPRQNMCAVLRCHAWTLSSCISFVFYDGFVRTGRDT